MVQEVSHFNERSIDIVSPHFKYQNKNKYNDNSYINVEKDKVIFSKTVQLGVHRKGESEPLNKIKMSKPIQQMIQ